MSVSSDDIPEKVDRYVILEAVGFGAMGAVYKAEDPLIKRTVAIKTIRLDVPPNSPHYQTFLNRFFKEARISGQLSHPNIVTLYDIGEMDNRIPYLAMEYVDGETVDDMLTRGDRLRPEQVVGLVSQMASAIDYAHSKGVIHRDIKPSNIIIFNGEKVKVTDFGIAKLMDAEGTQTASLLGTPSYMSPEQAMGEELDGRTDIFSLGVVAFEMLSGTQPFPGNNVTSVLYKLVHTDPVRLDNLEVLGLLPDKWHEVFSKVLAKNPAERYGTGSSFVAELELCLGSWFGSLEGETIIMSVGDKAPVPAGSGEQPTIAEDDLEEEKQEQNEGEETVFLESSERPTETFSPSSQSAEKPPSGETEQAETVFLSSGAQPTPPEASQTSSDITSHMPVTEDATAAYSPGTVPPTAGGAEAEATGEGETVQWSADDTQTVAPESVPASDPSSTQALAAPGSEETLLEPANTERTATSSPRLGRFPKALAPPWGGKQWAVAASVLVLVLALVIVGILTLGPKAPPPVVEAPVLPPPVEVVITGSLTVGSNPEGASVWVNDDELGVTPLVISDLELGSYTVRFEMKGFQTDDLTAELTEESPQARLEVDLEKVAPPKPTRATLQVQSEPAGARVTIDGQDIGSTPIQRYRVRPGNQRILRLELEGFQPWEQAVSLKAGVAQSIAATLEPIETAPPVPPPPDVRVGELVERGPDVVDPECIKCPGPRYPDEARKEKMQGVVQVSFTVTEAGVVQDIQIEESGGEFFDQAVIDTLQNWELKPATKSGIRVKVRMPSRRFRFVHR